MTVKLPVLWLCRFVQFVEYNTAWLWWIPKSVNDGFVVCRTDRVVPRAAHGHEAVVEEHAGGDLG